MKTKIIEFTSKNKVLLIFLLTFSFFKPMCLDYAEGIGDSLFNVFRLISSCAIAVIYLIKRRKPSNFIIVFVVLKLWLAFTTYYNQSMTVVKIGYDFIISIGFVAIIDYFSDDYESLINALMFNFEWILFLSLFTLLLFPNGGYMHAINIATGFMGNENRIAFFAFPAIFTAMIFMKYGNSKIRGWILILVSIICEIIVGCMTGLMGAVAAVIYYVLPQSNVKNKINYWAVLVVSIIGSVSIAIFRVIEKVSIFSKFVTEILKKDVTFSGRTPLWDSAIYKIRQSLFLGRGMGSHAVWIRSGQAEYFNCHNQILELLIEGGIPLLLIFLALLLIIGREIENKSRTYYSKNICLSLLVWLFVSFIFEAGINTDVMLPLILTYNISNLDKSLNNKIVN